MTSTADLHPLTIADWRAALARPGADARALLGAVRERCRGDDPAWIMVCDAGFIDAQLDRLEGRTDLPLFGVPFAVKDNIDVAGLVTTAACPAFAYRPERSAEVVLRLMAAGAVLVGKTNLDQFATGLVGTRSPYREVPNSFDAAYASGGSSSGSASVVARGLVAFALGTDTAGSGRVPAGFNNLVGAKPTPGRVPMRGVLPACRTLDVVSVFALTVADAACVQSVMEGPGRRRRTGLQRPCVATAVARPRRCAPLRVGIPADPRCDAALGYDICLRRCDEAVARLGHRARADRHAAARRRRTPALRRPVGGRALCVVKDLIEGDADSLDPVVRQVIGKARNFDAVAAFEGRYALERLRRQIAPLWDRVDVLMLPTAPTCPTLAAVAADPIVRNSELGRYTNFVNLLGWAALALPSGMSTAVCRSA